MQSCLTPQSLAAQPKSVLSLLSSAKAAIAFPHMDAQNTANRSPLQAVKPQTDEAESMATCKEEIKAEKKNSKNTEMCPQNQGL